MLQKHFTKSVNGSETENKDMIVKIY